MCPASPKFDKCIECCEQSCALQAPSLICKCIECCEQSCAVQAPSLMCKCIECCEQSCALQAPSLINALSTASNQVHCKPSLIIVIYKLRGQLMISAALELRVYDACEVC